MVRRTGLGLIPVLVTCAVVFAVGGLLQAVTRLVVSNNPERWGRMTQPVAAVLRIVFLVPAYLVEACRRGRSPHCRY